MFPSNVTERLVIYPECKPAHTGNISYLLNCNFNLVKLQVPFSLFHAVYVFFYHQSHLFGCFCFGHGDNKIKWVLESHLKACWHWKTWQHLKCWVPSERIRTKKLQVKGEIFSSKIRKHIFTSTIVNFKQTHTIYCDGFANVQPEKLLRS